MRFDDVDAAARWQAERDLAETQLRLLLETKRAEDAERQLAATLATEPNRTRAAVVKVLREAAWGVVVGADLISPPSREHPARRWLFAQAQAIEDGADW